MSRSFKKNAIHGMCSGSDKKDKTKANRKFRRVTKEAIKNDKQIPIKTNEISEVYSFQKDGKSGMFYTKNFLYKQENEKLLKVYNLILRK